MPSGNAGTASFAVTHCGDESRRLAKFSLSAAVLMMIVSVAGFIVTLVLNAFFLDKYNAYGEVPIPGSGSVHLPAAKSPSACTPW